MLSLSLGSSLAFYLLHQGKEGVVWVRGGTCGRGGHVWRVTGWDGGRWKKREKRKETCTDADARVEEGGLGRERKKIDKRI